MQPSQRPPHAGRHWSTTHMRAHIQMRQRPIPRSHWCAGAGAAMLPGAAPWRPAAMALPHHAIRPYWLRSTRDRGAGASRFGRLRQGPATPRTMSVRGGHMLCRTDDLVGVRNCLGVRDWLRDCRLPHRSYAMHDLRAGKVCFFASAAVLWTFRTVDCAWGLCSVGRRSSK